MRYTITLAKGNGATITLSECKRESSAHRLFDEACIETDAWMRSKADVNTRIVTGAGKEANSFVVLMLLPSGNVLASRTVRLVDNRQPADDLGDMLAASLIALHSGHLS